MRIKVENKITDKKVQTIVDVMLKGESSKGACIRELFAGGMDVKEISSATGIRYNHVYNVVRNEVIVHGLEVIETGRDSSNSKKAKIIELLEEGKNMTEVAKELKCMYNYVWQVAKGAGFVKAKTTKEDVVEVMKVAK